MSARWRALARALGPITSSSTCKGLSSSLSQAQALSAASLSTSASASIAGTFAPAALISLLSRHTSSNNQRSFFSADAAAVAPPPDDPSPPPPPPPTAPPTATAAPTAAPSAFGGEDIDDEEGPDASLTPSEVVARLDRHIVGQPDAKRAVANALRARWRRRRVPEALRSEIVPKNILMIGPTGCGKTEVARRLAKLADAPFVKVEATKFTEVGFHGRDVDSIIRDLVDASVQRARERARERLRRRIAAAVEDRILAALCGEGAGKATVDAFRELYRSGALDERKVAIELPGGLLMGGGLAGGAGAGGLGGLGAGGGAAGLFGPGGASGGAGGGAGGRSPLSGGGIPLDSASGAIAVQEVIMRVDKLLGGSGGGRGGGGRGGSSSSGSIDGRREMRVADARALVEEAEAERLISPEQVAREAVASAEADGIVFIDEIDKIVVNHETRFGSGGADASSEGVQRDLLPIIEGSVVATKHGNVATDHMLFICSGAFSACKPSDMLAELQGRLPIRVELKALTADDFYRILTEPEANMLEQQRALLATEGVELRFTDGAARAIAGAAAEANAALDNIGARRLHTVLERVLELVSFDAPETAAKARAEAAAAAAAAAATAGGDAAAAASSATAVVEVDEEFVKERMGDLLQRQDLSRYVL